MPYNLHVGRYIPSAPGPVRTRYWIFQLLLEEYIGISILDFAASLVTITPSCTSHECATILQAPGRSDCRQAKRGFTFAREQLQDDRPTREKGVYYPWQLATGKSAWRLISLEDHKICQHMCVGNKSICCSSTLGKASATVIRNLWRSCGQTHGGPHTRARGERLGE